MVPDKVPPNIHGPNNFNLGPNMQDPYEFCRCGSGKKNRWCCAPLEVEIDKAWRQASMGQHEGALRTLDSLAAANKDNPEVYGRKAELLFALGRPQDASAILEKAFALRGDYPFGNYLKAATLHDNREMVGSLILARKSLESYHPAAVGPLCRVLKLIFNGEMALNRPIAGRVALKMILKLDPTLAEAKEDIESHFGVSSLFTEAAKQDYSLLPPPPTRDRQMAWNKAAKTHGASRLGGMAKMFEDLTASDPTDIPACYNSVLTLAMIGNNAKALEALDRYFELEKDESRLIAAIGLAIVLKAGFGLTNQSDFLERIFLVKVNDPNLLMGFLRKMADSSQFIPVPRQSEEAALNGFLLKPLSSLVVGGDSTPRYGNLQGVLVARPQFLEMRCHTAASSAYFATEARQNLGLALNEGDVLINTILTDPFKELALVSLDKNPDVDAAKIKQTEFVKHYFSTQWIEMPLKILGDKSPKQALATPMSRIRLLGLLKYIDGSSSHILDLGFNSEVIKTLIGMQGSLDGSTESSGGLPGESSLTSLDQAFREARHHDRDEEAYSLGQRILEHSSQEIADLSHVFQFLARQMVSAGTLEEANQLLSRGVQYDRQNNSGSKTADLELARAQVISKQGLADEAAAVVAETARSHPKDLSIVARATEMLLGMKRAKETLEIGEAGLKEAKHQQNRDAEEHLAELLVAANRLG